MSNAKEIGRRASRIFESMLPDNWLLRSQEDQEDYGIDGEIELTNRHDKAQGQNSVFKVQIKGQSSCNLMNNQKHIAFSLKRERVLYYLNFNMPVLLVVVDNSKKCFYWTVMQSSENIKKDAFSKSSDNMTVHLLASSAISSYNCNSFFDIIKAVDATWFDMQLSGIIRTLDSNISDDEISKAKVNAAEILGNAYAKTLHTLLVNEDFNGLFKEAANVIKSPVLSAKDRFIASFYYSEALDALPHRIINLDPYKEKAKIRHLLLRFAKTSKIEHFRYISVGKARSLQFCIKFEELYTQTNLCKALPDSNIQKHFINESVQNLYVELSAMAIKAIKFCEKMISRAAYSSLLIVFTELSLHISFFKSYIKGTHFAAEKHIDDWYKRATLISLSYGLAVQDYFSVEKICFHYAVDCDGNKNKMNDIKNLILSHNEDLNDMLSDIERRVETLINEKDGSSFYEAPIGEQYKCLLHFFSSLGFNLDSPKNEIDAEVLRTIRNFSPEEVLIKCKNLFVAYQPAGAIYEISQIHSAGGSHVIYCRKKDIGTRYSSGTVIDNFSNGNESFKRNFCENCQFCEPRHDDWSWSIKWQHEKQLALKDIFKGRWMFP